MQLLFFYTMHGTIVLSVLTIHGCSFPSCVTICSLFPFLLYSPSSSYIFLGCCTANTTWSVHRVLTYLNLMTTPVVVDFDLLILTLSPLDLSKSLCYFWVRTHCLLSVNSLSSHLLPGVIVEVPQPPCSWRSPSWAFIFENLWVYACPYLGQ